MKIHWWLRIESISNRQSDTFTYKYGTSTVQYSVQYILVQRTSTCWTQHFYDLMCNTLKNTELSNTEQ